MSVSIYRSIDRMLIEHYSKTMYKPNVIFLDQETFHQFLEENMQLFKFFMATHALGSIDPVSLMESNSAQVQFSTSVCAVKRIPGMKPGTIIIGTESELKLWDFPEREP